MLNLLATKIDGLEIAYIAVGILLGLAIIAAFIAQIVIAIGYWPEIARIIRWGYQAESMRVNFLIRMECLMFK